MDEDGVVEPTQQFFQRERLARLARFGRMTPTLFAQQATLTDSDSVDAVIMVAADVPEPTRPYDGTDFAVSTTEYEAWLTDQANAQIARIRSSKARMLALLDAQGIVPISNPATLPTIEARIPVSVLRSSELNASDVARIEPASVPGHVEGYATAASMNAGTLIGGVCGTGGADPCSDDHIGVGLWERDDFGAVTSGIARNNKRIASTVYGYHHKPTPCTQDTDCTNGETPDVERFCAAVLDGGACRSASNCNPGDSCTNGLCLTPKMCVQDHLTWVAASIGMDSGFSYDYSTREPTGLPDPIPNVPTGTTFPSQTGAWYVNFKVGNDKTLDGLDYLLGTVDGAPTPFVNRSMSQLPDDTDWAGRAYGTFVTGAAGNIGGIDVVQCAELRNGLCVGFYDYKSYSDISSHRRSGYSNYVNNATYDPNLERPHLLGPGNHSAGDSGLHMPKPDTAPGFASMVHSYYQLSNHQLHQILGSSFSAPAVLSAAIQAQEYEGWFSALAFPMVNKAVLMASTVDANADGPIGKSTTWSSQPSDAEDGAGQLDFGFIKQILDNNTYYWDNLSDADFTSCGTGCRSKTIASISIPAQTGVRIALAWQSCLISETTVPNIVNDLDLALDCGQPIQACSGTILSNSVPSELEMIDKAKCVLPRTCHIDIRIKNGASLQPCGSTTTERVGVAWSFRY